MYTTFPSFMLHHYQGQDKQSDLIYTFQLHEQICYFCCSFLPCLANLNTICAENVQEQAYLALVWPLIEYGCCPHIQRQIKDIESKQRQAAHFVKNEYSTTPGIVKKILRNLRKEGKWHDSQWCLKWFLVY